MTHYTCTECGAETETPAMCTNDNCLKKGQPLTACECTDGEHGGEEEENYYSR